MSRSFSRLATAYGAFRAIRNAGLAISFVSLTTFAARAEPVTIAALGDSLTQGYGLPPEDGFVPRLQRWLDGQGADITLINAGVSGDTTAGGLSRIGWTLTPEVDALIVTLGGNDLLRGIDPAVARANLDGILAETTSRSLPVLLIGMDAPSNYGSDYETAFEAIYPDLAAQYGTLHHENFLGALAALGDRDTAVQAYMQPDRIHPNAEGVALIVEDIGPRVLELAEQVAPSE